MVLALFVTIFFSIEIIYPLQSKAEEEFPSNNMSRYVEVVGSYPEGETGFVYNDNMLLESSYKMSGDLAKVAVALSVAAYTDEGASARAMLESEQMGYIVGCFDYSYPSITVSK